MLDDEEARLLAGGQSLIATLNMRLDRPSLLVDLNGIPGLDRITHKDGAVELGALVRHSSAEHSPEIAQHAPLFALAMPHIGHPAIRHRGTVGGSIAFADPAAELPACVLAMDGEMEIAGADGTRSVKAERFFTGLFDTALGRRDVLTAIRVPAASSTTRVGFAEFARRHGDYAMVGLAARAQSQGDDLRDLHLCYFGVGTGPLRARKAEAALMGGSLDGAVHALGEDLSPGDDLQASAAVKIHLAGVLLRRVARQLAGSPGREPPA